MKPQLFLLALVAKLSWSLGSAKVLDEENRKTGLRVPRRRVGNGRGDRGDLSQRKRTRRRRSNKPKKQMDEPLSSSNDNARIINGSEARPGQYPFAASLQDQIGHFCGGSLIARDVVLTAAHCAGGRYNVVLGRHNLDRGGGQEIEAQRELPHKDYDRKTTDNDFMLVFLKSPATLNGDVGLVRPNRDPSSPGVGRSTTVMGWGDTDIRDEYSSMSDVLMQVQVKVISNKDCDDSSGTIGGYPDNYHDQITENMLCAKANRQDSCQGDSGGPLIEGNVQVGVVSWGIGCASAHFPGVYARVSRAYDWIEREVCRGSDHASEAGFDCPGSQGEPNGSGGSKPPPPSPSNPAPSPSGGWGTWAFDDDFDSGDISSGNNKPPKPSNNKPPSKPSNKPPRPCRPNKPCNNRPPKPANKPPKPCRPNKPCNNRPPKPANNKPPKPCRPNKPCNNRPPKPANNKPPSKPNKPPKPSNNRPPKPSPNKPNKPTNGEWWEGLFDDDFWK